MPEEFSLSHALSSIRSRITPEQRNAQDELNRKGRNLLNQRLMENRIAIARERERAVLDNLPVIEAMTEGQEKDEGLRQTFGRLGELYAEQGRYDEAIEVTPDDSHRKYFQLIKDALDRDDAEKCECPHELIVNRAQNMTIRQSPRHMIAEVYNPKTRRMAQLRVCRACGHANAS